MPHNLIPGESIERHIFLLRGERVMLSTDLAALYDVEPRALIQAVKRNLKRFPPDFMFQLTAGKFAGLKSQIVISSWGVPPGYMLYQNYPNPFNPSATIRYDLPSRSHVTLTIFNTLGQQVATLVEGEQEAGSHEAVFDASGVASGVYLYRLTAGSFVETRKLVLVR